MVAYCKSRGQVHNHEIQEALMLRYRSGWLIEIVDECFAVLQKVAYRVDYSKQTE